jgi:hypothetical protein
MLSGAYQGVTFHVLIEVPAEYPSKAPSVFFRSLIRYQNGAQTEVPGKGTSICLDLLGNFANVHTEWGSSASGWSPANTLQTILIQLQGSLNDMLSGTKSHVDSSLHSARDLVCSCGHGKNGAVHPPVATGEEGKKKEEAPKDWKAEYEALRAELETLRRKAAAYDLLMSAFGEARALTGEAALVVEKKPGAATHAPAVVAAEAPKLNHLVCYISGTDATDATELFGFGVGVGQNGALSTAGEVLSKTAFDGGVKRSSQNEPIDHFLPIYISESHFKRSKDLFRANIGAIYKDMASKKRGKGAAPKVEIQALEILCSLMNSACVATSSANGRAHDNFIQAYFSLLRLLRWLCAAFPDVSKHADSQLEHFLKGSRSKDSVPNLGEFLILLHASTKVTWAELGEAFVEEVDARNVRWFKDTTLQFTGPVAGRVAKTFAATDVSRSLVCFQVRFLDLAKKCDLKQFVDGLVPEALLKALKEIHAQVKDHKNWGDYFKYLGLKVPSEQDREKQLIDSVNLSAEQRYHGGGGGGGKGNNRRR